MRAGYHPSIRYEDKNEKESLKKQGFYHSPAWRRLRIQALQRDHFLCRHCLEKGILRTATEVHHRQPVNDRPDLALALDNLESLCWDCHELTKKRKIEISAPRGVRVISINGKGDREL